MMSVASFFFTSHSTRTFLFVRELAGWLSVTIFFKKTNEMRDAFASLLFPCVVRERLRFTCLVSFFFFHFLPLNCRT